MLVTVQTGRCWDFRTPPGELRRRLIASGLDVDGPRLVRAGTEVVVLADPRGGAGRPIDVAVTETVTLCPARPLMHPLHAGEFTSVTSTVRVEADDHGPLRSDVERALNRRSKELVRRTLESLRPVHAQPSGPGA